jgi:hypothetical protein
VPSYISSNANRLYAATEVSYGAVPSIVARNRFPAVKLSSKQTLETTERRDKTGTRTFAGLPAGGRRRTTFELKTYMSSWTDHSAGPGYGPMFEASLGSAPIFFSGGTAASGCTSETIHFAASHGLSAGQAIVFRGEIRFAAAIINGTTVRLNAPLSTVPTSGASIGGSITYFPSTNMRSVTLYDYWSPASAVQRMLCGVGVDQMTISVNGDYHEFQFKGIAQDLIDSTSFATGMGQLSDFPSEPAMAGFDYSIVPGNMGQAWLGNTPDRFFTITAASIVVDNNLDVRSREFGSLLARCLAPGARSVTIDFDLFEQDDDATKSLYQAGKQQSPISVMLQLGQQDNQLFGAYLKSVVPDPPEFDDSETRLQWQFRGARAQGTVDDEIVVAFG